MLKNKLPMAFFPVGAGLLLAANLHAQQPAPATPAVAPAAPTVAPAPAAIPPTWAQGRSAEQEAAVGVAGAGCCACRLAASSKPAPTGKKAIGNLFFNISPPAGFGI